MAHTYEAALCKLSSLQSNHAITSLFSPSAPNSSSTTSQSSSKAKDLNALAIPEMLTWLGRAGLSPAELSKLKCIHVAGTKGKGSVCAYLTSILTQPSIRPVAGRVGTYTSPHLISVRERIMLDGQPISQDLFTRYFFEVWDAFTSSARAEFLRQNEGKPQASQPDSQVEEELQGPATKPFYFRFLTIMAFYVFLREGVKSAVVECGIGGEYDGTNVLPPSAVTASVVTQLGIDHVGMLGGTLPEIAWHKIGVAKEGRKCFTRRLQGDEGSRAMEVMTERTRGKRASLVVIEDDEVEAWGGVKAEGVGGLEGRFQKYNQALAVVAAKEHLRNLGGASPFAQTDLHDLPEGFRQGLQQARLRGRCETREEENIIWLIDGAHTAESLQEVAAWFASKTPSLPNFRKVLIFNQQDRDAAKLFEILYLGIGRNTESEAAVFDKVIFTRNDLQRRTIQEPERDMSVQKTVAENLKRLHPNSTAILVDSVADAVEEAKETVSRDQQKTVVLATGSLHLIGALLRTLEPEAPI